MESQTFNELIRTRNMLKSFLDYSYSINLLHIKSNLTVKCELSRIENEITKVSDDELTVFTND